MSNNELKIDMCIALLELDTDKVISPAQLRGYIAYLFTNIPEFHHHSDNSYHYPLIQYKMIDEKLCVLGLQNYSDIVFEKISGIDHITIPDKKISINNLQVKKNIYTIDQGLIQYQFVTPWIALNKTNYAKFKTIGKTQRKEFLEKILVANVLGALKGLGLRVDFKISAQISKFKSIQTEAHKNKFVGFYCEFVLNIVLPNFLGIGKSVSKGFGVIERIK